METGMETPRTCHLEAATTYKRACDGKTGIALVPDMVGPASVCGTRARAEEGLGLATR